jgi:hypothetical protein
MQADVQSLQLSIPQSTVAAAPESSSEPNIESDNFPLEFHYHLTESSEKQSQGIEIKEVISDLPIAEQAVTAPQFWLENQAKADVTFASEPESVIESIIEPEKINSEPIINPATDGEVVIPVISAAVPPIGEVLPVSGGNLPSATTVAVVAQSTEWQNRDQKLGMQRNLPVDILVSNKNQGETLPDKTDIGKENTGIGKANTGIGKHDFNPIANSSAKPMFELETLTLAEKLTDSLIVKFQGPQTSHNPILDAGESRHPLSLTAMTSVSNLQPSQSAQSELLQLSIPKPENASEWGKGLGDRVSWMINQKLNTASLRLDPPMLGKLDIQIQVKDDITTIAINTQHAQTREMIENASFRLREHLQEAGFQNVNVDVSHDQGQNAPGEENLANSPQDRITKENGIADQASDNEGLLSVRSFDSDSLVDYFA